eukprot:COSAG01_NODE_1909_length_8928_cov_64.180315_13_plen_515_part_00
MWAGACVHYHRAPRCALLSFVVSTPLAPFIPRRYGCGGSHPNHSPYMKELIVRWYAFGAFCPVFRTHGCRSCSKPECQQEPDVAPCVSNSKGRLQGSCAANEVWSYGNDTQLLLEKFIRVRAQLKPYITELAANVSAWGVPTMRPLWYEFPEDPKCVHINDEFLLGSSLLVAPVVVQNATSRQVYFPTGANWLRFFNPNVTAVIGGSKKVVDAPLDSIPVFWRQSPSHGLKTDDGVGASRQPPVLPGFGSWAVSLHDDFDSGFNASLWTKGWSWCNGTGQTPGTPQPRVQVKASDTCFFADENVAVVDGKLVLTNKREKSHGFEYTSGVVNSISYGPGHGFQQTYGYFEARIQPSNGSENCGMCPAFWMPNVRNNGDDGNCEIDVMEIPGNPKFGGGHKVWGTVHATHDSYANGSAHGNISMSPGFWSGGYHDFAVLWLPGFLAWYVDGVQYFNTTQFVPDTAAYLVLDNEVGLGHLEGPDGGWAGNPKDTLFPQQMKIDHVTVWQRVEATATE